MLMFIWNLSAHIRRFAGRTMPTNLLIRAVMTRRGLKWGPIVMFLAMPYLVAAAACASAVAQGAPGWINLVMALCVWNAFKLAATGPASVARLLRWRAAEKRQRNAENLPVLAEGVDLARRGEQGIAV